MGVRLKMDRFYDIISTRVQNQVHQYKRVFENRNISDEKGWVK